MVDGDGGDVGADGCFRDTFYRVSNLDKRVGNADQVSPSSPSLSLLWLTVMDLQNLTEDVAKFCNALAHMHSQISKPILGIRDRGDGW